MTQEFTYCGKTLTELQKMDAKEFFTLLTARQRRSFQRSLLERHKPLLKKIRLARAGTYKKPIKTHARDMIVLPDMIGLTLHIHTGREFKPVLITEGMLGLYFGELSHTRQRVEHSAPGIGATKSSTAVATKAK